MEQADLTTLFNNNVGLVHQVYRQRLQKKPSAESMKEDLIQIGMLTLWKCCHKFRPDRGIKFSTYAYTAIYRNMLCYFVRESDKIRHLVSLCSPIDSQSKSDVPLTYEEAISSLEDSTKSADIIDALGRAVHKVGKNSEIIMRLLGEGYTQVEISEEIGVSKTTVYKTIKEVRQKFHEIYFSDRI